MLLLLLLFLLHTLKMKQTLNYTSVRLSCRENASGSRTHLNSFLVNLCRLTASDLTVLLGIPVMV